MFLIHDGENNSIATDDTCKIQPTWNASVCAGDIGRLQFSIRRGGATSGLGSCAERCRFAGCWCCPRGWSCRTRRSGARVARLLRGGAGPAPAAAAQSPIVLSRNGKDFTMTVNQSTVRRRYRDPCEDRKTGNSLSA